jgi:REP element-mobilizing transposase RayT
MRLPHYDYARAGYYFVTLVMQGRAHLFGEIVDGRMVLNVAGEMVGRLWDDICNDFPHVRLHESVIMPNHMHGIIEIVGADSISAQTPLLNDKPLSFNNADSY